MNRINILKIKQDHIKEQTDIQNQLAIIDNKDEVKEQEIHTDEEKHIQLDRTYKDETHVVVKIMKYLYKSFINKIRVKEEIVNSTSNSISKLQEEIITITAIIERKQSQLEYYTRKAIEYKKIGNKKRSINSIRNMRICNNTIQTFENMLLSYTDGINNIEQAYVTNMVISSMKDTKAILKTIKIPNIEKVEDTFEDVNELMEEMKEIQGLVGDMILGNTNIDEDELMEEFDNMEIETETHSEFMNKFPNTNVKIPNTTNNGYMVINFLSERIE